MNRKKKSGFRFRTGNVRLARVILGLELSETTLIVCLSLCRPSQKESSRVAMFSAKLIQSCVSLTLLTVACQASLSMGFSRQEYWNVLPFPSLVAWLDRSKVTISHQWFRAWWYRGYDSWLPLQLVPVWSLVGMGFHFLLHADWLVCSKERVSLCNGLEQGLWI